MLARASFGKRVTASPAPPPIEAPAAPPPIVVTVPFMEGVSAESLSRLSARIAKAQVDNATEIVIPIASPGGELLPMLELYHLLVRMPVKLTTFAAGRVASAATYLFLAGSQRIAHPTATFLFHEVSTTARPPAGSFVARSVERHRELFELTGHEIYRNRTALPHDMIARFAAGEIVLDALAALKFAVAHRIAEAPTEASDEPIAQETPQ